LNRFLLPKELAKALALAWTLSSEL